MPAGNGVHDLLGPYDVTAALALSDEARFNQTAEDWEFLASRGRVFTVRADARPVATAAMVPYEPIDARPAFGWLGMTIVTATRRRQGLATALLRRCLDEAAERDIGTWLDAHAVTTRVYTPLGFTPVADLIRMRRRRPEQSPNGRDAPSGVEHRDLLHALDRRSMGVDRSALLDDLSTRPGSVLHARDGAVCLVREGRFARRIGPIHAESEDLAMRLLDEVVEREAGSLIVDAMAAYGALRARLSMHGFMVERLVRRMMRGPGGLGESELTFASAGPEFG